MSAAPLLTIPALILWTAWDIAIGLAIVVTSIPLLFAASAIAAFTNIAGLPMGAAFGNGTAIDNVAFSAGCAAATVCSDKILQIVWTGAKYTIIPGLDVIGAYYHYTQNTFTSASCANLRAHSQCAGTFDGASAALDWQFAKRFDAYIGFMFSQ